MTERDRHCQLDLHCSELTGVLGGLLDWLLIKALKAAG